MSKQRKDRSEEESTMAGPSNIDAEWLHFQSSIEANPFYSSGPSINTGSIMGPPLYPQALPNPFMPPTSASPEEPSFPGGIFSLLDQPYPPLTDQNYPPSPYTSLLPWEQESHHYQTTSYPISNAPHYIHPSMLMTPSHMPGHSRSMSMPTAAPVPGSIQTSPRVPRSSLDRQAKSMSPYPSQSGSSAMDPLSPSSTVSFEDDREALSTDEKRLRNTQASARFRIRKKQRTAKLDETVASLEQRASHLEQEATDLRRENTWLKEIAILKAQVRMESGTASEEDEPGNDGGND